MEHLLSKSLADSMCKSYTTIWNQYQDFCVRIREQVILPLPVTPVTKYVAFLYAKGYKHATILTMLSVIAFVHHIRGLQSPTDYFIVKKVMAGVKVTRKSADPRKPISLDMLVRMLNVVENVVPTH